MTNDRQSPEVSNRRRFLAALISAVVGVVPIALGSAFFLAPLWRKRNESDNDAFVPTGVLLDALPGDGTPLLVTVTKNKVNAWNMYPDSPVGSVWLRNIDGSALAFNSICPHLGCAVEHRSANKDFYCPCHNSNFDLDGLRLNQIPPRDLDVLETKLVEGEIWVRYQNFRAGTAKKIEV